MAISNLRKSNVAKFLPIVSNDEVMKELLTPDSSATELDLTYSIFNSKNADQVLKILNLPNLETIDEKDQAIKDVLKNLNNIVSSILVSTFHSLSINISFTTEILDYISKETYRSIKQSYSSILNESQIINLHKVILNQIGEYVKVVHEDYNVWYPEGKKKLSETNFAIKKNAPNVKNYRELGQHFEHKKQYGLIGFDVQKINRKKYGLKLNVDVNGVDDFNFDPDKDNVFGEMDQIGRNSIFNAREIVDYKMKYTENSSNNTGNTDENDLEDFLNFVPDSGDLKIRDENTTSISYIMMNNPRMRAGTKNSLELSTFFNSLSTIELSKCLPFLDIKFILPGEVKTKGANIFKTASITQFLDGTNISDFNTTDNYKVLEASFTREAGIQGGGNTRQQNAVETNLSAFTMPQTINNFDELYVGHLESYSKELKGNTTEHDLFKRNNTVHDYAKPFLTIKSFNIDVAPTQGLMSFKTGKLSLILHDKTRMSDIAPFIKPDLFGSFGAEIAIKYGWSHMDAINPDLSKQKNNEINYFGKFLNDNKVYEKYIITNSSYNIDANGQVNIDLAIAMKGPVSIRAINFETEKPKKIASDLFNYRLKKVKEIASSPKGKINVSISTFNSNADAIITDFQNHLDVNTKRNLRSIDPMYKLYRKHGSNIRKQYKNRNNSKVYVKTIAQFFYELGSEAGKGRVLITKGADPIYVTSDESKVTLDSISTTEAKYVWDLYRNFIYLLRGTRNHIDSKRNEQKKNIDGLLQKITEGLSLEDAFFDIENFSDVERISDADLIWNDKEGKVFRSRIAGLDSNDTNKKELTSYVSLGNIILAVVGSHLSFSKGYDEIQVISYTLNDNAGAAFNKNISSLLVDKTELNQFLSDLFKNGAQYTLESLLTQIIKKFFTTRYCYNYGLRDLYRINENGNVEPNTDSKKPNEFEKVVNERLQLIHEKLFSINMSETTPISEVSFVMPKIKLSFDTMTSDASGGSDTILRISVFDQNDNPFTSVTSIMNKIFESDVESAVADINKRRIALKSLAKKDRNYSKAKKEFIRENELLLQQLIKKGFLREVNGQFVIDTSDRYAFESVKERLKGFMPSLTHGTHNSAIIDASISTINEAKLNTVYLTRPGRNDSKLKTQVRFKQDLPLRILPSQANLTIFGCPFVNFAQYLFLDFETNTTVDNQYAVTGIKHEISPGKFTTKLTLSYGDAYGKYENIVDTLSRTAQEIEQGTTDTKEEKKKETNTLFSIDESTLKNNKNLIEIKDKTKNLNKISAYSKNYTKFTMSNDHLMYDVNIKNIRLINYKNLDSLYYNIKVEKPKELLERFDLIMLDQLVSKDNKAQVNIEELILSVSETNKTKDKVFYINIRNKIVDSEFSFDIENIKHVLINSLIKENEKYNDLARWKKSNPTDLKFYEDLVKNQKELFNFLLKIYMFPYIKIHVKKISSKSNIGEIEFVEMGDREGSPFHNIESIYFENSSSEFKKYIFDNSIENFSRSSKDNNVYIKFIGRKKYNCTFEDVLVGKKDKIFLNFTFETSKKSKKKQKFNIEIGKSIVELKKTVVYGVNSTDVSSKIVKFYLYDS